MHVHRIAKRAAPMLQSQFFRLPKELAPENNNNNNTSRMHVDKSEADQVASHAQIKDGYGGMESSYIVAEGKDESVVRPRSAVFFIYIYLFVDFFCFACLVFCLLVLVVCVVSFCLCRLLTACFLVRIR